MTIEYDGSKFFGWQRQKDLVTVQGTLEKAISCYFKSYVYIIGAGRTDTGVHAMNQVAHFTLKDEFKDEYGENFEKLDLFKLKECINHHVDDLPVVVLNIEKVSDSFHSIISAKSRTYVYKIINRRENLTFGRKLFTKVVQKLDVEKIKEAASYLIGIHDFSSFRSSRCQSLSPVKNMMDIKIFENGDLIEIYFKADAFLHHQIRNIIGCFIWVGIGKWSVTKFLEVFNAKDRTKAATMAPSDGLYLYDIEY